MKLTNFIYNFIVYGIGLLVYFIKEIFFIILYIFFLIYKIIKIWYFVPKFPLEIFDITWKTNQKIKYNFNFPENNCQVILPYQKIDKIDKIEKIENNNLIVLGYKNNIEIDITQPYFIPYLFTVEEFGFDFVIINYQNLFDVIQSGPIDITKLIEN